MDGCAKSNDDSMLFAQGESSEVWVIVEFDCLEVGLPVSPVAILLFCGAAGDCVAGSKLHSQVIIFNLMEGSRG
jgi:hypothetical protein